MNQNSDSCNNVISVKFLHLSEMKIVLATSLILALAVDLSQQFYPPPFARQATPQPTCRQVPKETCQQVPKTTFDTVKRRQCQDVADTVCTNANEKKCQISQKPVQDTELQRQCR